MHLLGIPYIKDSEEASESMSASTQFEDVQIILPPKFVEPLLAEVDGIKHLGYFRLVAKVSRYREIKIRKSRIETFLALPQLLSHGGRMVSL